MKEVGLEDCNCPYCKTSLRKPWALENGFHTVQCTNCGFLYLSPRPSQAERTSATDTGTHASADNMDITERYVPAKVSLYRDILAQTFMDVWSSSTPISWVDIGSGYGEVMDAVKLLAASNSKIMGIEPMATKAKAAIKRGLRVQEGYVGPQSEPAQYASLINVFSHIYDFDSLLKDIHTLLLENGELFLETGDMTKVVSRNDLPFELGSPDHVAFASESHIRGLLERNGFDIISIDKKRVDTVLHFAKSVIKKAIGRAVIIKLPYTSPYRTMFVRARKR
jgi:Zn ribbon nucleic-acid-binding protein